MQFFFSAYDRTQRTTLTVGTSVPIFLQAAFKSSEYN